MSAMSNPILTLMPRDPRSIIEQAISEHSPRKIIALTSGGQDSTAALLASIDYIDGAAYIDTGTALPGVREHVEGVCAKLGVQLDVYETPWSEYESMVLAHGFPGPAQHRIAYIRLKERRVRELARKHKQHRRDRIMLITGVREQESVRRMATTAAIQRAGSLVWVAPIIEYDKAMVRAACRDAGIAPSDVSALLHRSGECNCGAFAQPGERGMLAQLFPEWWERIEVLEAQACAAGVPCVWGESPGEARGGVGPMCSGCEQQRIGGVV